MEAKGKTDTLFQQATTSRETGVSQETINRLHKEETFMKTCKILRRTMAALLLVVTCLACPYDAKEITSKEICGEKSLIQRKGAYVDR